MEFQQCKCFAKLADDGDVSSLKTVLNAKNIKLEFEKKL